MDALPSVDQAERTSLLQDIRLLADRITRLGFNLPAMTNLARVMSIAAEQGKDAISTADLEAAQAELTAAVRGFRRREAAQSERVFNYRMMIGAGAIAALFGGAMVQKACDPIGRAHAYLTTRPSLSKATSLRRPEGATLPVEPEPQPTQHTRVPEKPVPVPAPLKSAPPESTPAIRPPPPPPPASSRGRTVAPEPKHPRIAKAPRAPRDPEARSGPTGIVDLTDRNFERLTSRGIWVVDFYADWCAPCQKIKPVFDGVFNIHSRQRSGVRFGRFKVNDSSWDEYALMAKKLDVGGIPTIIFFSNGREIGRLEGAGHTSTAFEREIRKAEMPDGTSDDPLDGLPLDGP